MRKLIKIYFNFSFLNLEYTLISPTDEAFSLIPLSIKQQLNNDTEFRLNFIKNHIINGRLFFKSISNGQELMVNTVSNNRIHILSYPNGVSYLLLKKIINYINFFLIIKFFN